MANPRTERAFQRLDALFQLHETFDTDIEGPLAALTRPTVLFDALVDLLQMRDGLETLNEHGNELDSRITRWQELLGTSEESFDTACAMVQAARAAANPSPPHVALAPDHAVWNRYFQNLHRNPPRRITTAPIAATNNNKQGRIGTLELTFLEGGTGRLARHPGNLFQNDPEKDLIDALQHAWDWAQNATGIHALDCLWKLWLPGATKPSGASLGGAALRAMARELLGAPPDPGVLVLAAVGGQRLSPVLDTYEKVMAVTADSGIDTIVVATAVQEQDARATLPRQSGVKLVCLADPSHHRSSGDAVAALASIRSQCSTQMADWFAKMRKEAARRHLGPKLFDESYSAPAEGPNIFQKVRLVTRLDAIDQFRAAQQERLRETAGALADIEREPGLQDPLSVLSQPRTLGWEDLDRQHRLCVLAGPGAGKTWLVTQEAIRLSVGWHGEVSSDRLERNKGPLPILVNLAYVFSMFEMIGTQLTPQFGSDPAGVNQLIAAIVYASAGAGRGPLRLYLERQLRAACGESSSTASLETGPPVMLLDGWDEMTPREAETFGARQGLLREFGKALEQFAGRFAGRIVLTSRRAGYLGSPIGEAHQVEIMPLTQADIRRFVSAYFAHDNDADERVTVFFRQASGQPMILELMTNPQQLRMLCEMEHPLPNTRTELYQTSIQNAFEKVRGTDPASEADDMKRRPRATRLQEVEKTLAKLVAGAYGNDVSGRITQKELQAALPNDLMLVLRSGLLTPKDDENSPDCRYAFEHRSVAEYLLARHWQANLQPEVALSPRDAPKAREEFCERLTSPAYQEPLVFLAGLLGDESFWLIDQLLRSRRSSALVPHYALAARCLAEVPRVIEDPKTHRRREGRTWKSYGNRVFTRVIRTWWKFTVVVGYSPDSLKSAIRLAALLDAPCNGQSFSQWIHGLSSWTFYDPGFGIELINLTEGTNVAAIASDRYRKGAGITPLSGGTEEFWQYFSDIWGGSVFPIYKVFGGICYAFIRFFNIFSIKWGKEYEEQSLNRSVKLFGFGMNAIHRLTLDSSIGNLIATRQILPANEFEQLSAPDERKGVGPNSEAGVYLHCLLLLHGFDNDLETIASIQYLAEAVGASELPISIRSKAALGLLHSCRKPEFVTAAISILLPLWRDAVNACYEKDAPYKELDQNRDVNHLAIGAAILYFSFLEWCEIDGVKALENLRLCIWHSFFLGHESISENEDFDYLIMQLDFRIAGLVMTCLMLATGEAAELSKDILSRLAYNDWEPSFMARLYAYAAFSEEDEPDLIEQWLQIPNVGRVEMLALARPKVMRQCLDALEREAPLKDGFVSLLTPISKTVLVFLGRQLVSTMQYFSGEELGPSERRKSQQSNKYVEAFVEALREFLQDRTLTAEDHRALLDFIDDSGSILIKPLFTEICSFANHPSVSIRTCVAMALGSPDTYAWESPKTYKEGDEKDKAIQEKEKAVRMKNAAMQILKQYAREPKTRFLKAAAIVSLDRLETASG